MARLILLALLLVPAVALADPASLVFFALNAAGASTIVTLGVTLGVSLLGAASARRKQRAAASKQRAAYLAGLQDRNVTVLSTEAPWKIVYGSPAPIGGAIQAILTSGAIDEYQHLVIVFNARPSYSIDEIYLEGEPVGTLDASGWCTGGAFYSETSDTTITESVLLDGSGVGTVSHPIVALMTVGVSDGDGYTTHAATVSGSTVTAPTAAGRTASVSYTYLIGTPRVNIQKHLSPAGVDTADAFLIAACPDKWTSAHKASGLTYIVLTLDLRHGAFQGGPPNVTAKGHWSLVYDYRTTITEYSNNPALCAADFLTAEYGFGAGASQIDSTAAIAAANACYSQGFQCHGLVSTDNGRDANLQQIEDAMAGATHFSGGVWRIMAGAWATPVMTLTDAYMAAPIEVVQASHSSDERWNTVRGQYSPAAGLGTVPDFTPYVVASYVTDDGKEKPHDLPLPMVGTNAQCQKLAAIAVERSRLGETINYPAHLGAWKLQPGDRVYVTNAELGYVAKTFRMVDWTFSAAAPVGLVLTEDTAAVYTGTFTNADAVDPTSNLPDPSIAPPPPALLAAVSGTEVLQIATDGTIVTRVLVTWQASTQRTVLQGGYTQLQWRLSTVTDDDWQNLDLPADAIAQYLTGVPDGTGILIRVRHVSGLPLRGLWSTIAHTVLGKTEAPADVATFSIDGQRLSWSYPTVVPDLAGFAIRFNYGTNTWWDGAASLHDGLITDNPYTMAQRPAGTVTLLIKAVDTSGNYSANAAVIVVDLGDQVVENLYISWPQAPTFTDGTISGGSIVSGELKATATDLFYGPDLEPFYGPDADVFYAPGTYSDMSYTWPVLITSSGTLLLDHDVTASNFTIEYQRDSQAAFYGVDADYFYGPDDEPFYGAPAAWATWPGSLVIVGTETITLRISTVGGDVQGVVTVVTPKLDVPDVVESFSDIVIAAGGTRLPITLSYRAIVNISLTSQADGNGGITARAEDKSATLGPLVKVFDASGTAVIGLIDADIQGY